METSSTCAMCNHAVTQALFIEQTDTQAGKTQAGRPRAGRQLELLNSIPSEDCDDQAAPYKPGSNLGALISLIVSFGNENTPLDWLM
ncbi:MAG: hypothetical protein P0121_16980 [Nitrospira sp.]|nr:hypothetical protein [Nitrospira sp.]